MHAGLLNVLHDGANHHLLAVAYRVDVDLNSGAEEPIQQDRRIFGDSDSIVHVTQQVFLAIDDLHRAPPKNIRRAHYQRIANIGYPLVVRPSYVLGGRAMEVVYREEDLLRYMNDAVRVSEDSPVLLDRFLSAAIEVDIDAVSDGEQVVIGAIMQHIEQAGVHSGDSACSLPPYSLPEDCLLYTSPSPRD